MKNRPHRLWNITSAIFLQRDTEKHLKAFPACWPPHVIQMKRKPEQGGSRYHDALLEVGALYESNYDECQCIGSKVPASFLSALAGSRFTAFKFLANTPYHDAFDYA